MKNLLSLQSRHFLLLLICLVFALPLSAQSKLTVKGHVVDEQNEPIISATVVVIGQANMGAMTDIDGNFQIADVPSDATLRFSYVGYKTIEVPLNGRTSLTVVLKEDSELLDEVVVTALGIKRQTKALAYNVQEIKGDQLSSRKDPNFVNSLNGKIAGVTINTSSAGMGSAARVVMRGTKSIQGNNNALYVIDGVPIYSLTQEQGSGRFSSSGSTESAADINPDDIASISVLTGASAAALYGSAAANGAILITTKKGQAGAPKVSYAMNMDFGRPMILPDFQSRYGSQGNLLSWGSLIPEGDPRWEVGDFFRTASNMTHSVSVSGGTERNQTYVSGSVTTTKGLVPNNSYNRYNLSARNNTSFLEDRLNIGTSASLIFEDHMNLINQGEYMNPLVAAYLMPRSESLESVKNFEKADPSRNIYVQNWAYGNGDYTLQNPYWIAYRNLRGTKRERYILGLNAKYDIMKWSESDFWNVAGRVRWDRTLVKSTDKRYATTEKTHDVSKNGYYGELKGSESQTYADLLTTVNKGFELQNDWRLNVNATLGASIQDTRYDDTTYGGPLREDGIPNVFNIFNIDQGAQKTKPIPHGWIEQTQSIFGSMELGLNSYLYLTLTGRNDWASQLANSPQKSFFYPSVGLSGVITEMLDEETYQRIRPVLNYFKVRLAYSSVASPFQRGLTTPVYLPDEDSKKYKTQTYFPIGQLYPERTNSYEVGISSRWLNGLITLDGSYYLTDTNNQTLRVAASPSSGYDAVYIQTGSVRNQGVELALGLHLGKDEGFRYDGNFTYGYNHNKIVELADNYYNPLTQEQESQPFLDMNSMGSMHYILKKGGSLGDIYTTQDFTRDAKGRVLVNKNGSLSVSNFKDDQMVKLGSVLPSHNLGWTNELSYKGLSLGFALTGRVGGVVVSMTQAALDHYGVSEATAAARDLGYVPVDGRPIDPQSYFIARGMNRLAQYYVYDATNFRLQDLHISYRYKFPASIFISDATLSLYGRNLCFIYNKAPFDPESVSSTANYNQGMDYFMLPSQRTLGFSLSLNF